MNAVIVNILSCIVHLVENCIICDSTFINTNITLIITKNKNNIN
jgi:hypothetical protein